jgi:sec-independent protein translocase protein TatA
MGAFSIWHILLIVLAALLLFGGNKLSNLMGDAAKGIRAFKDGLKDQPEDDKNDNKNDGQPKPPKAD